MSVLRQPAPALRAMTVADLDAVLAIEAGAYSHPWTRGNFVDSLAASHWAEIWQAGDGALQAYYVAMAAVDELHLLNLTVASPVQGRGLGRQLLERVVERGRGAGLGRLLLEVRTSNERAQHLYARRGFEIVGRRRGYYPAPHGRREDAIVMSLSLEHGGAPHAVD